MENATNTLKPEESRMNKFNLPLFIGWILCTNIFFYNEYFGLNALIICLVSIPILTRKQPKNYSQGKWWLASCIWIFSAIGVFVTGGHIHGLAYALSFLFFIAITYNVKLSIPIGMLLSINAFIMGMVNLVTNSINHLQNLKSKNNKWLMSSIIFTIPVIIIVIFLKLYQTADKSFYEWTKFINLDWISWGFIFSFFILTLLLYGFFYFENNNEISEIESDYGNEVTLTYSDRLQKFFGLDNEYKIALSLVISLNLLLLLYNALDAKFLLFDMHSPTRDNTLSELVHQGIYALIASIILVIVIISVLFRGQLNFKNSKYLTMLVLIWLVQNGILIASALYKNYAYVDMWGLTYKRIGVFLYLALALIGIFFTIVKLIKVKSFWYLFRSTSLAFAFCLSLMLTFNWNRLIASYNTTYIPVDRIDFEYLYFLGPDTYSTILKHHSEYNKVPQSIIHDIRTNIPAIQDDLTTKKSNSTWKSLVLREYLLTKELKQFKFN